MLECVDIMRLTGSDTLSLWLADGTNYPGQGDFRARKAWLDEALQTVAAAMDEGTRMLIEYKVFEPAFYHTDLADWGCALWFANRLGKKGEVLVDLGHHSPGVNVEYIVAFLLDEGKLGGFHFNNRKYADDDLIVGSINPYELFLIFNEIIAASADPRCADCAQNIAYMIDQCHYLEPKIPAMIRSVLNIQTAYAKALLVNREALAAARMSNDSMAAEACVREAFEQDVSPLLISLREEMGVPVDPMDAYQKSGYEAKIATRKPSGGWD
jgi:L-rhamnose isomerase/sugar isomerase